MERCEGLQNLDLEPQPSPQQHHLTHETPVRGLILPLRVGRAGETHSSTAASHPHRLCIPHVLAWLCLRATEGRAPPRTPSLGFPTPSAPPMPCPSCWEPGPAGGLRGLGAAHPSPRGTSLGTQEGDLGITLSTISPRLGGGTPRFCHPVLQSRDAWSWSWCPGSVG